MTYSLVVGWLDPGTTTGPFAHSLAQLCAYEAAKGRLASVVRIQSGPNLEEGRNTLVEAFYDLDADWLLMVDSDMVFDLKAAEDLLAFGSPGRPVLGGLCFGINDEVGVFPTLYDRIDGLPAIKTDWQIDEDGLVQVAGTGAAFLAIHRSVVESLAPRWFTRREVDWTGRLLGEDLSFCWDVGDKGFPIFVVPSVKVGHVKSTVVYEDASDVPTPWL